MKLYLNLTLAVLYDFAYRAGLWLLHTAKSVEEWGSDPEHRWRSWVGHTLLVLGTSALFGPLPAIFLYFMRKVGQAWRKFWANEPQDWEDNILDIVIPMWALALVEVARAVF